MTRSSGIELIVQDCPEEAIMAWIRKIAKPISESEIIDVYRIFETRLGRLIIQQGMGGPNCTAIWFQANDLPWSSSAACARIAVGDLNCKIICDPENEYPEVSPFSSVMLEVSREGERLIEIE